MSSNTTNQAAWITAPTARPFKVVPGPKPDPESDEVVIKVAAVALNPSEWKMQDWAFMPLNYPHVLGSDVAGVISQVGKGVSKFKTGQRVIGHCAGLITKKPTDGAFQAYSTCKQSLVAEIPDALPFTKAVVLPLSVSTAAAGLFQLLDLTLPTLDPKPNGKTVLIWGGSSSMGSTSIQLAKAAGYTVATTASARNEEYVRSLGTAQFFDHTQVGVVDKIVEALQGANFAGVYDCIADEGTARSCAEILTRLGGGVLPVTMPAPGGLPENVKGVLVNALDPAMEVPHIGAAVWGEYVPAALAKGVLQAKPDPLIFQHGLEEIQEALDVLKKGVSASKVVVVVSQTE